MSLQNISQHQNKYKKKEGHIPSKSSGILYPKSIVLKDDPTNLLSRNLSLKLLFAFLFQLKSLSVSSAPFLFLPTFFLVNMAPGGLLSTLTRNQSFLDTPWNVTRPSSPVVWVGMPSTSFRPLLWTRPSSTPATPGSPSSCTPLPLASSV